jgi:transposase
MGQAEFCHSRGISRSTLYRYLSNRRRQEPAAATQLVPVEVVDVRRSSGTGSSALAVVLGNGRKIEVGQGFDAATLQQLVGVLERG